MIVPSPPKLWIKDCVVRKVPFPFVSCSSLRGEVVVLQYHNKPLTKSAHQEAGGASPTIPPTHEACSIYQDVGFAKLALHFLEERLDARFVRYIRWYRKDGKGFRYRGDVLRSEIESVGLAPSKYDTSSASFSPRSRNSLTHQSKIGLDPRVF